MKRFAFALSLLLTATPASAEWMTGTNPDAFNGDIFYAFSGGFNSGGGFNCTKEEGQPMLILLLPDKVEDSTTAMLKLTQLNLAIIVDDDARVDIPADFDLTSDGSNYRVVSKDAQVLKLLAKVRDAKRRVGVGLVINDKVVGQTTFDVDGSGVAIRYLEKHCDLKAKEDAAALSPPSVQTNK